MSLNDLKRNAMMAHLLESIAAGKDIGHYGRLVFAMVARHFLSEQELVKQLAKCKGFSETDARALVLQVNENGYNPPRAAKIAQWQREQEFPICPGDATECNVYRELQFPRDVYESIGQFYEERAEQRTA